MSNKPLFVKQIYENSFLLKIVSNYVMKGQNEIVMFIAIGHFDTYQQKLAYDGNLQLTNCFIQLSADVKTLRKYENVFSFMEFY